MTNPYRSPTLDERAPRRLPTASAQSIAVLCFGLLPAAVIFARVMHAITDSVRGWDLFYWIFSVVPPLYLTGAWLLAIGFERRRANVRRILLPVALFPLVLFLTLVWCKTIVDLWQSGKYVLTGWIAIDHLLWLAASVPVVLYFVISVRSAYRFHRERRQTADEPSVATEAASQPF